MSISYPKLEINSGNPLEKRGIPSRQKSATFDVAVIGGGMAGICAAVAAARNGAKTVLIHDRSVLGGNASSEIRVCVCGAIVKQDGKLIPRHETGIIEEILLENRLYNPQDSYEVWDHILYGFVTCEDNLELMLDTQAVNAITDGDKITAAVCRQATTEIELTINAHTFIDCSGDGLLAAAAGAVYRTGREAVAEFDESYAEKEADGWQMGASLMFSTRNMGQPTPYIAPHFAIKFDPETYNRSIGLNLKEGYWWVELGSDEDVVAVQEVNRHKLMGYIHGVWDYIKNSGKFPEAENLAIDWIGSVPGKRESRRFVGDWILSQKDLTEYRCFDDAVAYGGWPLDEHAPGGIENHKDPAGWNHQYFEKQYQIPFRCLYSANISNLLFAGRNISQTHIALSSTRVMATCAVMGHAVGIAAAMCKKYDRTPREIGQKYINELQNQLLLEDAYIPQLPASGEGDVAKFATLTASSTSSGDVNLLVDGYSRDADDECHHWQSAGLEAAVSLEWDKTVELSKVQLRLDTNIQEAVWKVMKAREKVEPYIPDSLPPELVKKLKLEAYINDEWRTIEAVDNISKRVVNLVFEPITTTTIRVVFQETYGAEHVKLHEIRC